MRTTLPYALIAAVSAAALLAGCDQRPAASQVIPPPAGAPIASMGLDEGAPPPPVYAPPADRIAPARRPIRVSALGPDPDRYLYVDDAYDMMDAFGDSPPDYAFDYEGIEPWVWRSDAGYYRVVEVIPGGLREYYYGPRDDEPFLIRDPRYAYAYDDGALVAAYDPYGRALPPDVVIRQADYAGRYYDRARALHYAALHQQRRAAYAAQWRARQDSFDEQRQRWALQRDRDDEWRRLRDRRDDVQRTAWVQERRQREDYAAKLAVAQQSQSKAFLQARREDARADQIRAHDQKWARDEANRPHAFAGDDARRFEAERRQAQALAQADRKGRDQADAQQRQALQQQRFAEQQSRQAERQRGEAARVQQARAADQHAAQAAAREQAQADLGRRQADQRHAEQQQRQAERQQGQQRQAMEQQRAQQRQAQMAERERGQQAQRAQAQQREAQAQQRQAQMAERQRGQQERAQAQQRQAEMAERQRAQQEQNARQQQRQAEAQQRQAQMAERQRGRQEQRAQAQQRQAEAQQRQAQAQQQRAEAANAQRQARDASAHEHAAQAAAQPQQHGNGKDKHDHPH